jgi:hypothetical protein
MLWTRGTKGGDESHRLAFCDGSHCTDLSEEHTQKHVTFDQAQRMFRQHRTYETACTYLDIASQRKEDETIGKDTFFNAVGEVANWL